MPSAVIGLCVAGEGAIGRKHLEALSRIDEVEVRWLIGVDGAAVRDLADRYGIRRVGIDLHEALEDPSVDAVLLATPTPLHARQAVEVLHAGKHVLIEIPMADSLEGAADIVAAQQRTGLTAMVCHTRRFNPSHRWIHDRITAGDLQLQHLVVTTLFLRRSNLNALGEPRSWTDHLLWHHACHTVDLFRHQSPGSNVDGWAHQGPADGPLGIAMDASVSLRAEATGALCTLALSFNNDGPFGSTFRYICDRGTFVAEYDELIDGHGRRIDVIGDDGIDDGIEVQDREFLAAIDAGRDPEASVADCLETMRIIDRLTEGRAGR